MGFYRKKKKGKFPSNKKVKNATPLLEDGIQFKSKLEAYCYRHLKANGVVAAYEQNTYTLIAPFEYNGEKVRACTYTPDFVGDTFVLEVKGFANESFPLRWKMFKNMLRLSGSKLDLYLPKNQKEVLECIQSIKDKQKIKSNENK